MCTHMSAGGDKEGAALLSSVELVAARSGGSLEVGQETVLKLILCPTPRWPDLLVAYSPSDRLLFTSKLFSAHVRCMSTPLSLCPGPFACAAAAGAGGFACKQDVLSVKVTPMSWRLTCVGIAC